MISITEDDRALCAARAKDIDHARVASLHFLGNYTRHLPVSIERMMENALDWEHLPYIHASSFSAISKIANGRWGWRAKTELPAETPAFQVLELLVDHEQHYWATAVLSGPGEGIEIHTRATSLASNEIEIDVRFYSSSEVPENEKGVYWEVLSAQYATLYDEDLGLMSGREDALDNRQRWQSGEPEERDILVGTVETLSQQARTVVDTATGRFCVRQHRGKWIVHSAVCSHLLGPLDDASVNSEGIVTCPWHGYSFSIETGESVGGKCKALAKPPLLREAQGNLYLVFSRQ